MEMTYKQAMLEHEVLKVELAEKLAQMRATLDEMKEILDEYKNK